MNHKQHSEYDARCSVCNPPNNMNNWEEEFAYLTANLVKQESLLDVEKLKQWISENFIRI